MKKILSYLIVFILSIQFTYSYELTNSDQEFVNTVTKILEKKDDNFNKDFSSKLDKIINNGKYSNRIVSIFTEINNFIQKLDIEIIEENIVEDTEEEIEGNKSYIKNVNIWFVKNNWLNWNNELRENLWLEKYSFNETLEKSALIWSTQAKEKWEITHKRNSWDWFYEYSEINNWFKENWVVCENISWITHTENIRWWGYVCTDWECSNELSDAVKKWAFDSYVAEKWTSSDAHYRSLTQQYFTNIWLWIDVEKVNESYYEYYLTIHYCTKLIK